MGRYLNQKQFISNVLVRETRLLLCVKRARLRDISSHTRSPSRENVIPTKIHARYKPHYPLLRRALRFALDPYTFTE